MKELQSRYAALKDAALKKIPERFSRHEGHYSVDQYGVGVKDIFRNGLYVRSARITDYLSPNPKKFVRDEFVPSFAIGDCVDISDGDYKSVMIDHEGKSDYVIKRFKYTNIYQGEGAKEKAEKAAAKIDSIYRIIEETSGFHILPNEVFAFPYSDAYPNDYAVYEVQQRGIFVDHWAVFDPKKATRIDRETNRALKRYYDITLPELLKRGIVTPDKQNPKNIMLIADHMAPNASWDIISNRLVARDVVDAVYV